MESRSPIEKIYEIILISDDDNESADKQQTSNHSAITVDSKDIKNHKNKAMTNSGRPTNILIDLHHCQNSNIRTSDADSEKSRETNNVIKNQVLTGENNLLLNMSLLQSSLMNVTYTSTMEGFDGIMKALNGNLFNSVQAHPEPKLHSVIHVKREKTKLTPSHLVKTNLFINTGRKDKIKRWKKKVTKAQKLRRETKSCDAAENQPNNEAFLSKMACRKETVEETETNRRFVTVKKERGLSRNIYCLFCNKAFSYQKSCKKHELECEKRLQVSATVGKNLSPTRESKRLHIQDFNNLKEISHSVNSNEGCFKCDICYKEFGLKANMEQHKRIHNPSKWIQCPFCEYKVAQGIKRHINAKHGSEVTVATLTPTANSTSNKVNDAIQNVV